MVKAHTNVYNSVLQANLYSMCNQFYVRFNLTYKLQHWTMIIVGIFTRSLMALDNGNLAYTLLPRTKIIVGLFIRSLMALDNGNLTYTLLPWTMIIVRLFTRRLIAPDNGNLDPLQLKAEGVESFIVQPNRIPELYLLATADMAALGN